MPKAPTTETLVSKLMDAAKANDDDAATVAVGNIAVYILGLVERGVVALERIANASEVGSL